MLDRIVISMGLGIVGGLVFWSLSALILWLNTMVPYYAFLVPAIIIAVAIFIIDIRTRTDE